MIRFDGQAAIVTGAGGGLGYAVALELAKRGASVLANDYGGDTYGKPGNDSRAERVALELRSLGAQALADDTAVSMPEAVRAIVGAAMAAFGRVDILVNNAGILLPGLITDHSDATSKPCSAPTWRRFCPSPGSGGRHAGGPPLAARLRLRAHRARRASLWGERRRRDRRL